MARDVRKFVGVCDFEATVADFGVAHAEDNNPVADAVADAVDAVGGVSYAWRSRHTQEV